MEFRPKSSTIDNIFLIRHTFKKYYEYNIYLHNIFVGYTRGFNSVRRNKITECLV
jgi:hypothetical protein